MTMKTIIDPKDEDKIAIHYLESTAQFCRTRCPAQPFSGRAEFILAQGRMFERGKPRSRRGGWFRARRQCFRNACCNVSVDPAQFVYCEGYYWKSFSDFAVPHGWFLDRAQPCLAIDTTLPNDADYRYCGVPIQRSYVARFIHDTGESGSVLDWRESGYPIYTGAHPLNILLEDIWIVRVKVTRIGKK
jgi:hypothetical protein